MKRLHILIRLFVLVAMMLSVAEAVWASTCASMASMAVADPAMSDAMPEMPGMPGHGEQQGDEDAPSCPLAPAAVAQGCLTAALLPATSAEPFALTDQRAARVSIVEPANERMYSATPFHPPRV